MSASSWPSAQFAGNFRPAEGRNSAGRARLKTAIAASSPPTKLARPLHVQFSGRSEGGRRSPTGPISLPHQLTKGLRMTKFKLEYIWLDGYTPTPNLRGKTQIKDFEAFPTLEQLPLWGFDGSSTMQAEGHSSDCV